MTAAEGVVDVGGLPSGEFVDGTMVGRTGVGRADGGSALLHDVNHVVAMTTRTRNGRCLRLPRRILRP